MSAHGNPSPEDSTEKKEPTAEELQKQAFEESVPNQGGTAFLATLAGLGATIVSPRDEVALAIKALQDKNFVNTLLKSPEGRERLRAQYNLLNRELKYAQDKARLLNRTQPEQITTGRWVFKKFISVDEFTRYGQMLSIAEKVDGHFESIALESKISAVVGKEGFNLNSESQQKLRENLAAWQKDHPGTNPNNFLLSQGRRLSLIEKLQGEKFDNEKKINKAINKLDVGEEKKTLNNKEKVISDKFQEIRADIRSKNQDILIREQQALAHVSNPKRKILDDEQFGNELTFVIQGTPVTTAPKPATNQEIVSPVVTSPTQPPPGMEPTATSVSVPQPSPAYIAPPSPPVLRSTPTSVPTLPASPSGFLGRLGGLGNFFGGGELGGLGKIGSFISGGGPGGLLGGIGKGLGGLLGQGLGKLAPSLLKLGTGPIGWVDTALNLLGIDTKKIIIAVVGIVAVVIVFFVIVLSQPPPFTNITADQAMPLGIAQVQEETKRMSWSEFNDLYLTLGKNVGDDKVYSWNQLDKNFLSLEKTP
jgi:hypothetical protein